MSVIMFYRYQIYYVQYKFVTMVKSQILLAFRYHFSLAQHDNYLRSEGTYSCLSIIEYKNVRSEAMTTSQEKIPYLAGSYVLFVIYTLLIPSSLFPVF